MDLVVYDDDEQRYVPWAVALAALLLAALLTAALTFLLVRQASGAQEQQAVGGVSSPEPATAPSAAPSTTSPGPAASPEQACVDALLQADAALERSVAIDEALTKHTQIMDELLAERIDARAALNRALPVLTDGATERRRFQQDLQAYSQARQECPAS